MANDTTISPFSTVITSLPLRNHGLHFCDRPMSAIFIFSVEDFVGRCLTDRSDKFDQFADGYRRQAEPKTQLTANVRYQVLGLK